MAPIEAIVIGVMPILEPVMQAAMLAAGHAVIVRPVVPVLEALMPPVMTIFEAIVLPIVAAFVSRCRRSRQRQDRRGGEEHPSAHNSLLSHRGDAPTALNPR